MSAGQASEALPHISQAIKAVPDPPGWFLMVRIQCKFMLGNLTEALAEAEKLVADKPDCYPGPGLAAALAIELDRPDLAATMCQKALQLDPRFSVDTFVKWQGLKDHGHRKQIAGCTVGSGASQMSIPTTQRRLSAILAADVVGYSKLMAEDEAGTLAALHQHRETLFDPETAKRGGRIVKLMGDGTLAEFPSVVDAVECALSIQNALAEDPGPIKLRIGINLGDIIIDGDDIYGDGVNIAARLEALAEPGGICIASIVHESLGNRVDASFRNAGEYEGQKHCQTDSGP